MTPCVPPASLLQILRALWMIHLDLNKRQDSPLPCPPSYPETLNGKLIFKMNNELISWPVNLPVAGRPEDA